MQKRLALALCALLALGLMSCGANTETAEDAGEAESAQEEAAAPEETEPEEETEEAETAETLEEEASAEEEAAGEAAEGEEESAPAAESVEAPLVLYFSRVGNTDFPPDVDALASASVIREGETISGNAQVIAQWIAEESGGTLQEIKTVKAYPAEYRETMDAALQEQKDDARPVLVGSIEDFESAGTVYLVFPNWWDTLPMPLYTLFDKYDFTGKTLYVFITHGGNGFAGTIGTMQSLEPGAEIVQGLSLQAEEVPGGEEAVRSWVKEHAAPAPEEEPAPEEGASPEEGATEEAPAPEAAA